jgi:hypothetical protein
MEKIVTYRFSVHPDIDTLRTLTLSSLQNFIKLATKKKQLHYKVKVTSGSDKFVWKT